MSKTDKGNSGKQGGKKATVSASQKDFEGLAELFSVNGIVHRGSVCDPSRSRRASSNRKA